MEKIKLLQVVTAYQSVVTILESKLQFLSQNGAIDLYVVSSPPEKGEGRKPSGKFKCIYIGRTINPIMDFVSVCKLFIHLKRNRIDIVHTHTAKAGQIGAIAGWLAGIPVVHTYHGLPYYEGQNIFLYLLFSFAETVLSFLRAHLFSQNSVDFTKMHQSIFYGRKVSFEGNAVDIKRIEENAAAFKENISDLFASEKAHVLCISRLEAVKSLDKVVDLVMYLNSINLPVECIIAGKGHLKKSLNARIKKLGIENSIRIVYTPFVHSLIDKADLVVLSSQKEGVPRGVLEAMVLRKPVIATNVLGTQEIVVDNKSGLLVPYSDQDAFNKSTEKVLRDQTVLKQFGEFGRMLVVEKYSDEKAITEKWLGIYTKLLTNKKSIQTDVANRKRVLFVTTVGFTTEAFLLPYINLFREQGFEVSAMANWSYHWNKFKDTESKVNIPFSRIISSYENLFALLRVVLHLRKNSYSVIYTHTPIASMLVRFAKIITCCKSEVIYEIHGLHIHGMGNKFTNIIYTIVETLLSKVTDKIITINHDDFKFSKKHFKSASVYYAPGIGVDTGYYKSDVNERVSIRAKYQIPDDMGVVVTIADFIKRKRIDLCIKTALQLKNSGCVFKWLIAGSGPLIEQMVKLIATNSLQNDVLLVGQQADVRQVLSAADVFVLLSMQEGLPRSIMEAASMAIPIVASDIRGNNDIITNGVNSFLVPISNVALIAEPIKKLLEDSRLRSEFGCKMEKVVHDTYSLKNALKQHRDIFFDKKKQ